MAPGWRIVKPGSEPGILLLKSDALLSHQLSADRNYQRLRFTKLHKDLRRNWNIYLDNFRRWGEWCEQLTTIAADWAEILALARKAGVNEWALRRAKKRLSVKAVAEWRQLYPFRTVAVRRLSALRATTLYQFINQWAHVALGCVRYHPLIYCDLTATRRWIWQMPDDGAHLTPDSCF